MCTAFSWGKGRYFGRNLDLEYHYHEAIVTVGRQFPLPYRHLSSDSEHFAMIGVATVVDGYPLFYDAMNEYGLCIAGLHFVGNAYYREAVGEGVKLAPYELIPYLLSRAKTVSEAKELLTDIALVATPFSRELPLSELHFLLSDKKESLVIEPRKNGLKCYHAPYELLTNNPPYAFHMLNCQQYAHLSAKESASFFSRGLSSFGLPGDYSSASRFVRALFVKKNAVFPKDERLQVGQCFHILSSVAMVEGCIRLKEGMPKTVYSVCLDREKCAYYVTTYDDPTPRRVALSPDAEFSRTEIFS